MIHNPKRIIWFILSLALIILLSPAYNESPLWVCSECGKTDNADNYCGVCAHPAPWIKTAISSFPASTQYPIVEQETKVPVFDITVTDFESVFDSLIQTALTWDKKTAPVSLFDFPLLPNNLTQFTTCPTVDYSYKNSIYTFHIDNPMPVPYVGGYVFDPQHMYEFDVGSENVIQSETMNEIDLIGVEWGVGYNPEKNAYYRHTSSEHGFEISFSDLIGFTEQFFTGRVIIVTRNNDQSMQFEVGPKVIDRAKNGLWIFIRQGNQNVSLYYSLPDGKLSYFNDEYVME